MSKKWKEFLQFGWKKLQYPSRDPFPSSFPNFRTLFWFSWSLFNGVLYQVKKLRNFTFFAFSNMLLTSGSFFFRCFFSNRSETPSNSVEAVGLL